MLLCGEQVEEARGNLRVRVFAPHSGAAVVAWKGWQPGATEMREMKNAGCTLEAELLSKVAIKELKRKGAVPLTVSSKSQIITENYPQKSVWATCSTCRRLLRAGGSGERWEAQALPLWPGTRRPPLHSAVKTGGCYPSHG